MGRLDLHASYETWNKGPYPAGTGIASGVAGETSRGSSAPLSIGAVIERLSDYDLGTLHLSENGGAMLSLHPSQQCSQINPGFSRSIL